MITTNQQYSKEVISELLKHKVVPTAYSY